MSEPTAPCTLFLVSSPLAADPVAVDHAVQQLQEALTGVSAPGEFVVQAAEVDAVAGRLAQRNRLPFQVLHYLGHGYKPEQTPEGVLIFEDKSGGIRPLDPLSLLATLNPTNRSTPEFQVAVLMACHSESVAKAMSALHVQHIVAVEADKSVYEVAAIAFLRRFYQTLLSGGTVQEAFDGGRNAVLMDEQLQRQGHAHNEAGKFKLLPEGASHAVTLHGAGLSVGIPAGEPHIERLPSLTRSPFTHRPASFIGRERDMQAVLQRLAQQRALTITGVSGVGKTELAKETARWLTARRRVLAERVWFVGLVNARTTRDAISAIAIALGATAPTLSDNDDQAIDELAACLPQKSLLLLDEAENVRHSAGLSFRRLLEALATAANHSLILVTTQSDVGSPHLPRYELQRLASADALLLFARAATISSQEWQRLNKEQLAEVLGYVDHLPRAIELVAHQWRHHHRQSLDSLLSELRQIQDEIMHDPTYPDEVKV